MTTNDTTNNTTTTEDSNTTDTNTTTGETVEVGLGHLIGALKVKVDAANAQILHLGLLVEYLYKELSEKDTGLNLEGYPAWAEARFKEIQDLGNDTDTQHLRNEMEREMEEIAKNINLN